MHASDNGVNITLAKAFNDFESVNALPEYFICSVMAELQITDQQFVKLLLSDGEFISIFVASDASRSSDISLLLSHGLKVLLI